MLQCPEIRYIASPNSWFLFARIRWYGGVVTNVARASDLIVAINRGFVSDRERLL